MEDFVFGTVRQTTFNQMKYTEEERQRLVTEYAYRTKQDPDKVSRDLGFGYLIEKYGSSGDSYLVENPDHSDDDGKFKKTRRKNTHLTPKKKKRKK